MDLSRAVVGLFVGVSLSPFLGVRWKAATRELSVEEVARPPRPSVARTGDAAER